MKKVWYTFIIFTLLHSGFLSVSLAQEMITEDEAVQLDDIEKNVNNMLKMLDELQIDEDLDAGWSLPKEGNDKTEADPMERFVKPKEVLKPVDGSAEKNRPANSIQKTNEVVRYDSERPDSHFQLGLEYWVSKNFDAAILEFQEAVRLEPENAHAYWNLGLLYDKNKQGTEAIANIKKAEVIYSKYGYPAYAKAAKKRLQSYSEKYANPANSISPPK